MGLKHDAATRARLAALKRQIKEIESGNLKAAKKARAAAKGAREKALSRADGQRRPRIKDPAYLAFVRRQPCIACGKHPPVQAAHVRCGYHNEGWRPTGMMEKPDDTRTLPLCRDCHLDGPKAQHKSNEREWWASLGIYPPEACERLLNAYKSACAISRG